MMLRPRKVIGWLALWLGTGCLILTGFDALSINFSTPVLLPVAGIGLLLTGAFLILFTHRRPGL